MKLGYRDYNSYEPVVQLLLLFTGKSNCLQQWVQTSHLVWRSRIGASDHNRSSNNYLISNMRWTTVMQLAFCATERSMSRFMTLNLWVTLAIRTLCHSSVTILGSRVYVELAEMPLCACIVTNIISTCSSGCSLPRCLRLCLFVCSWITKSRLHDDCEAYDALIMATFYVRLDL